MKLIVGLGNPGLDYHLTRHNAGFMVIDHLATRHKLRDLGPPRRKFHGETLEGLIANERCLLLQPLTYMNRSGLSVGEAATFYKIVPDDVMIVVDDTALPLGKIRLRGDGSPGGHNGLADVERALGTQTYPRLRIGIDPPAPARQVDYVLGRFSGEQLEKLKPALGLACDAIESWIKIGLAKAASTFNAK